MRPVTLALEQMRVGDRHAGSAHDDVHVARHGLAVLRESLRDLVSKLASTPGCNACTSIDIEKKIF